MKRRRGRSRCARLFASLGTAVVLAAIGAPVTAAALGPPLPSPNVPSILPSSVPTTPLPSPSPLALPVAIPGTASSPTPSATTAGGGGTGGGTGGGGGGGGSTHGSGGGGGHQQAAGGGGQTGPSTGSAPRAAVPAAPAAALGPLPAFPGLPKGAFQQLAWGVILVVPLLLVVWVLVLFRAIGRLRMLRSSSELIAAASELGLSPREIASLPATALEKLRDQLALDELTGCMRRASGVAALERELARARRDRGPLTIGFVDADGLKHANDTLGHAAGDQLLKDVAEGLRERLRGSDFVFRYGGDEFVCVLPGATSASATDVMADVQSQLRSRGRSFSFGIAELLPADTTVALLGRADEALYAAKRARREAGEPGRTPTKPRVLWSAAGTE